LDPIQKPGENMKFFTKNLGILYLLGGCFIGCFIGFKVLPTMLEPEVPSAEIVLATQNYQTTLPLHVFILPHSDLIEILFGVVLPPWR
jgi:hypothetical protein